jgi:hypothetical protein
MPAMERRLIAALPAGLRSRAALRRARSLVRDTYPGSRAIIRVKRENASIDLRGSLFCEVREASALPLCGFYAAAIARVLDLFAIPATAQVIECRSSMTRRGCAMAVTLGRRGEAEVERPENAA